MSQVKIQGNASGTGIFTIASPNSNTNRTLDLPDNSGTILTTGTAGVPVNGPAFSAIPSGTTSVSNATFTKVAYATEEFDTSSNYDTANSRFTPTVAGYYLVSASINYTGASIGGNNSLLAIYKNGSWFKTGSGGSLSYYQTSALIYMNGSTDYLEVYAYQSSGGSLTVVASNVYQFSGVLVRSA
jgi:hypothetical protein